MPTLLAPLQQAHGLALRQRGGLQVALRVTWQLVHLRGQSGQRHGVCAGHRRGRGQAHTLGNKAGVHAHPFNEHGIAQAIGQKALVARQAQQHAVAHG